MLSLSTMQKNWSGSINGHGLMYVCVHLSVCGADPVCLCVCGGTHPCTCVWRSEEDTSVFQHSISCFLLYVQCVCVPMGGPAHWWKSEDNLQKLVFFFYCVGIRRGFTHGTILPSLQFKIESLTELEVTFILGELLGSACLCFPQQTLSLKSLLQFNLERSRAGGVQLCKQVDSYFVLVAAKTALRLCPPLQQQSLHGVEGPQRQKKWPLLRDIKTAVALSGVLHRACWTLSFSGVFIPVSPKPQRSLSGRNLQQAPAIFECCLPLLAWFWNLIMQPGLV